MVGLSVSSPSVAMEAVVSWYFLVLVPLPSFHPFTFPPPSLFHPTNAFDTPPLHRSLPFCLSSLSPSPSHSLVCYSPSPPPPLLPHIFSGLKCLEDEFTVASATGNQILSLQTPDGRIVSAASVLDLYDDDSGLTLGRRRESRRGSGGRGREAGEERAKASQLPGIRDTEEEDFILADYLPEASGDTGMRPKPDTSKSLYRPVDISAYSMLTEAMLLEEVRRFLLFLSSFSLFPLL
jgi:hypothetical protein